MHAAGRKQDRCREMPTSCNSPLRGIRVATADARFPSKPCKHSGDELAGSPQASKHKVVLFYHSGNRDESAFERPWEFDVTPSPNHHLGLALGAAARTIASGHRWRGRS